jgi:CBS domain-containing protein
MKASDIMTKNPSVVTPETPLREAAKLMRDQDVGMLPVVDERGSRKVVAVVTDRDIATRCVAEGHDSSKCAVTEVMSKGVRTCKADDDVDEIMSVMGKEQVRRIPIVDERGDLIGVVAQADIVRRGEDNKEAERTVEKISQPSSRHSQ